MWERDNITLSHHSNTKESYRTCIAPADAREVVENSTYPSRVETGVSVLRFGRAERIIIGCLYVKTIDFHDSLSMQLFI